MNQYLITYKRTDMPAGYTGVTTKWAHNEKEALKFILATAPKKNSPIVTFKRGGYGEIISIQEVKDV